MGRARDRRGGYPDVVQDVQDGGLTASDCSGTSDTAPSAGGAPSVARVASAIPRGGIVSAAFLSAAFLSAAFPAPEAGSPLNFVSAFTLQCSRTLAKTFARIINHVFTLILGKKNTVQRSTKGKT